MSRKLGFGLLILTLGVGVGMVASAQDRDAPEPRPGLGTPQAAVTAVAEDELPPISPKTSPGKMTLDNCIDLGFQHQPALDAARASLGAAYAGQRALDKMILPRLMMRDFNVRRQQSCQGVTSASGSLTQAEWETRYAITRNFFTVQYVRSQREVIDDVLKNLADGRRRANELYKSGDIDVRITLVDIEALDLQIGIVKSKKAQIEAGEQKAFAALREAMGVNYDYPLEIAAVELPPAVYGEKKTVIEETETMVEVKDKDGKLLKDKAGKIVEKKVIEKKKKEVVEYKKLYQIDKKALIEFALANRGEITQANAGSQAAALEIEAQRLVHGLKTQTFAAGGDIHPGAIPPALYNGLYRPGALGPEYPTMFAGRKADRLARAEELYTRSRAVVDKAINLVSLDVEVQYLNLEESAEAVQSLQGIQKLARDLPGKVQKLNPKDFTSAAVIQANTTAVLVRTQLNEAMHNHAIALAGLERASAGAFRIYPVPAAPTAEPMKK
jgi:outer membrane protein TolC